MPRRYLLPVLLLTLGVFGGVSQSTDDYATLILHNGTVVTMVAEGDVHEAIALDGDRILALGSDEEILSLADPATELVNLDGAAVFPGFIDPHTHLFDAAHGEGLSFDEVQQLALENGITTAANMGTSPEEGYTSGIDEFVAYANTGAMRIRLHLYLKHTDACGNTLGFWYEEYPAGAEIAPWLYMGGVKIFAEQSICDGTIVYAFSKEAREYLPESQRLAWPEPTLVHTKAELIEILERVQAKGYQAAIHAIGDLAAETCLAAYEEVLAGNPNELRHMILHNHFLRDDLIPRYALLGVIALVEMSSPAMLELFGERIGEENLSLFRRWRELLDSGAVVALDSDWPWFPISPIDKLRAFVGGESVHPGLASMCPCPDRIPQTVSTWQALQMMTTNAAYALGIEETLGTLEKGKLADLVILNRNPLGHPRERFDEIAVTATFVDGNLAYSSGDLLPPHGGSPLPESVRQDREEFAQKLIVDAFDDGDMESRLSSAWFDIAWKGGALASPIRVERDQDGAYLLLDMAGQGGVGVHNHLGETDCSTFDGMYVVLSVPTAMGIGLNILSTDPEWPSGHRDTYAHQVVRPADVPTTLRMPFTDFIVGKSKWDECPECGIDLDPSRIFYIGVEAFESRGELRIYEVGFYKE